MSTVRTIDDTKSPSRRNLGVASACATAFVLAVLSACFVITDVPLALVPSATAIWVLLAVDRRWPGTGCVPATFLACCAVWAALLIVVLVQR